MIERLVIVLFLFGINFVTFSQNSTSDEGMSNLKTTSTQRVVNKGVRLVYFEDSSVKEFETLSDIKSSNSKIVGISLQNQDLKTIPQELYNYTSIEWLDVSHNQIRDISAKELRKFSKLKKLYINGNEITELQVKQLRKDLKKVEIYYSKDQFQ